jgi:hypothetical protein
MGGDEGITKEYVSSMRMIQKNFQPLGVPSDLVVFPVCQIGRGHKPVFSFLFFSFQFRSMSLFFSSVFYHQTMIRNHSQR